MGVRVAEHARWVEVDDGAVIFQPATGVFVDLDVGGAALWTLLIEASGDLDQVTDWIVDASTLSSVEARRRVDRLAHELVSCGVLVETPAHD